MIYTFYDNYKKICDARGLKPRQVVKQTGSHENSIDAWKNKGTVPNSETVYQLSKILNVPMEAFFDDDFDINNFSTEKKECSYLTDDDKKMIEKYKKLTEINKLKIITEIHDLMLSQDVITLPLFDNQVSAGVGFDLSDSDTYQMVTVENSSSAAKADYLLQVNGNSMYPEFEDGDIVLVKNIPSILQGQIGIFINSTSDCKGYIKKLGKTELISLNPEYDNIPITDCTICKGLVLGKATLSIE